MRSASSSLALLLWILPACGGSGSDSTDTDAAASSGALTTGGTTAGTSDGQNASTTASPTTTDSDPSAGPGATTDPGETSTSSTGNPTTGEATTGEATTGAAEELPPIDSADALEAWLAGGAYKQWAAESKVHASTGPHGGNVRTYVNAIALGSLAAQQAEHPQDAALVKELYGDSMDTLIGYAVMRKTAAKSEAGANWYWYERIDANIYADGPGVLLCSGCHGGGADYILTPYPLQ